MLADDIAADAIARAENATNAVDDDEDFDDDDDDEPMRSRWSVVETGTAMMMRIGFGVVGALISLAVIMALSPRGAESAGPRTTITISHCDLVLRNGERYIWPTRADGLCYAMDAKKEHLQR